jgi:hypothetical protein
MFEIHANASSIGRGFDCSQSAACQSQRRLFRGARGGNVSSDCTTCNVVAEQSVCSRDFDGFTNVLTSCFTRLSDF